MQRITSINNCTSPLDPLSPKRGEGAANPKKNPINAKGIAKIVWLNLINER